MRIFDMHIHDVYNSNRDPARLIADMEKAGIYGGCVLSAPPKEQNCLVLGEGLDFEERLSSIIEWTKGYEDRIFPVLWIHPKEKNIIKKLQVAVDAGIVAFKMICNDYHVYEEAPMAMLREIARLGVPVIFHSGILWDGCVSSPYNRPLDWEHLLDIDGLVFSMGHCSWPWIDECIALYGKFLNAKNTGKRIEMFFDITPGTPEIYRRELLTKLCTIGYNIGNNILFGTDCMAGGYYSAMAEKWLKLDGEILDELGVSLDYRKKLYEGNMYRFLGKSETVPLFGELPSTVGWCTPAPYVKEIIEKWYRKLSFPTYYDGEFYEALENIKISDAIDCNTYDVRCKDGKRNLLSYLFFCEKYARECAQMGIDEKIVMDTLSDLVRWCNSYTAMKGELYLGELEWLNHHLNRKIFQIGRLQYCITTTDMQVPKYGVQKGDKVIDMHIPAGEKLTAEACKQSIEQAKTFFAKHFPEHSYSVMTCKSWLLDEDLKQYLSADSGILQFAELFEIVERVESFSILKYLFAFDTTPANVRYRYPVSSFAREVQRDILAGKQFYASHGVIPMK